MKDLFEHLDELPPVVREIVERYNHAEAGTETCIALQGELEPYGYTFEWGLDGEPHSLRRQRKIQLMGFIENRSVYLNGVLLSPEKSQKVWNKSPDGFAWGYGGSGPAQLALAICLEFFDEIEALKRFQDFKREHIVTLPFESDFDVTIDFE